MSALKVIGWIAVGGLLLAGSIGGVMWWRNRQRKNAEAGPTPSNPPRKTDPAKPDGSRNKPGFDFLDKPALADALVEDINRMFGEGWPPDNATIDKMDLQPGDVVVFAVESTPTEDFELARQEIINAAVLSVEPTEIRARVIAPVEHTSHHGNYAGHGLYFGALVEVPRSHLLAAGRPLPRENQTGYGSRGPAAFEFKPSDYTKKVYKVHPSTPYDLVLPYRSENLYWDPNRDNVKFERIGEKGLLHQIMFTEASIRGPYSVTLLDNDQKLGEVVVARWDFDLAE
jgi:hypothetical protein